MMKRSRLQRSFSLTMAFLMLFISSGFSLDAHFCDGQFKRASLLGHAMSCAEVQACAMKCGKPAMSCSKEKDGCCDNESLLIDFDFDSGEVQSSQLSLSQEKLVIAFASSYCADQSTSDFHHYTSYIPPPLIVDSYIVYQSFLC